MATDSQLEESDVPWTTAPEHARELLRDFGVEKDTRMWNLSVEYAGKYGLNGEINSQPKSVAAASVYVCGLLCNRRRSQAAIAETAGVGIDALRGAQSRILDEEGFR